MEELRPQAAPKLEILPKIAEVKAQSATQFGIACEAGEGELGNLRFLHLGRVAQRDGALPFGAVEKSTIPRKNRGILISVGSRKSEQERAENHDKWNCASLRTPRSGATLTLGGHSVFPRIAIRGAQSDLFLKYPAIALLASRFIHVVTEGSRCYRARSVHQHGIRSAGIRWCSLPDLSGAR